MSSFRMNYSCPACGKKKGKNFDHTACGKKLQKQAQLDKQKQEKKNETSVGRNH